MLDKDFTFVEIPQELRPSLGEQDPGTPVFRAFGSEEDCKKWFDAVLKISRGEGNVSPGGVSMYAAVSRPAVYKRLKEGRLTGFFSICWKKVDCSMTGKRHPRVASPIFIFL